MDRELILGRYRPLSPLGEGGHGAVVLAYDTRMSRRVAIKRIPVTRAGMRNLDSTRGLSEARTSALLNHPNVVTVHEWDSDADEAFLIMEYVDGAPLLDVLDEFAPLSDDAAATVLGSVARALAFAHDNGVLHLDLKPDNVLVTRDGTVKVGDFGVASLTNAAGQAASAGGTLGYMPPEQLLGEPVGPAADQWAFAALAFEVLTGAVPFAATTVDDALRKAEDPETPLVTDYVPSLPAELDDVLATALSPVPAERYDSTDDLAAELLPLLGDPTAGAGELAGMVDELTTEEQTPLERAPRIGLWDRLVPYQGALLRLASALVSGWMAYAGLRLWTGTLGVGAVGGAILIAIAGAAAPPLGLALALPLAAFASGNAYAIVAALVLSAAWWALVARGAWWTGVAPFFAPVMSAVGLGPAMPMLSGYFLPGVWDAVAAGAISATLALWSATWIGPGYPSLLGRIAPLAAGPFGNIRHIETTLPQWWLAAGATIVAWAVAAAICWLAARAATRGRALVGIAVSSALMLAASGPWATGGQRVDAEVAVALILSLILMIAIVALGPPVASEPDEEWED